MTMAQMPSKIANIQTKQSVTWHQCPTLVRNYLADVTYDPTDYTTSQIQNYAPATAVTSNTKPIGTTIDGVTYYNDVPNVDTPFSSTNSAGTLKPLDSLRWLNTTTFNVRDLGGWTCDGGTVKYGMLVRGGEPNVADKNLMVNKVGIKHELQLRGTSEAPQQYSLWDIPYTCPTNYVWMSITDKTTWKEILSCVFDTVNKNVPLYFHCTAGADRTGTVAVMLEALLGMSQSDIDKDYELTCFATGTGTDQQARRRNEAEYADYITAIKSVALEGGLTDTFRNRAVSFVLSLGFTIAEINAFRTAMIDGNPTVITVSMDSYTITKSGSNVTFDNSVSSVDEYQGYKVNLSANSGYVISNVTITMNGNTINAFSGKETNLFRRITNTLSHCTTNNSNYNCIDGQGYGAIITADSGYTLEGGTVSITVGGVEMAQEYYSNGIIAIPNVSGDVVISVTAVAQGPSHTNIWATPYRLNSRLNTAETDPDQNGAFISAWYPISQSAISGSYFILRSNKNLWNYQDVFASNGDYFRAYSSTTTASKISSATMNTPISFERGYDSATGIYSLKVKNTFWSGMGDFNYFRWCAQVSSSAIASSFFDGCILTLNEEIA